MSIFVGMLREKGVEGTDVVLAEALDLIVVSWG